MVFISMNKDDLLTRTAQYQIQYQHPRSARRGFTSSRYEIPSHLRRDYSDDEDEECRTAQIPSEFTASAPSVKVTTEYSDERGVDEDHRGDQGSNRRPLLNRIGQLPFESDLSDDGADGGWPGAEVPIGWDPRVRRRPTAVEDRSSGVGGMTLDEAREANQVATQEALRAVGGVLMSSLARFHFEKGNNVCTIHFDPPVSARFLLLKMWSPLQNSGKNIDIQAVIVKGFAGPRYIPSVEMR